MEIILAARGAGAGTMLTIPAPVGTMPDSWMVTDCPLCGKRRRYLPTDIFKGKLSHKFHGGQNRVVFGSCAHPLMGQFSVRSQR